MHIGHINLASSMNGTGEQFIRLVEALDRQGVSQHVLVANTALARRVAVYDGITVGPVVKTPVMAYCLMPEVDVAHMHCSRSGQAGLLLTLTRSIPFVLTRRSAEPAGKNPLVRSMISRAASVICPTEEAASVVSADSFTVPVDVVPDISHESVEGDPADTSHDNRIAAEHLRIYRRAVDSWRVPALLL